MSNDIRDIIRRLDMVEGRLSPAQQKVPQLPALFKPRHIRALGSKTDPAHPMDGYMVGDSIEPRRTALEEAMAEIEEDMLSKVKRDLTTYLDRLEKKVAVSRDLKDKAKDAVERGRVEEFAPVGGDDREPNEEEILRQLAAQWWNGTEQQMAKAQRTLAAMGWEIGPDESGDDDAGVYVYRIGDEDGRDTIPFAHSDLDILDEIDSSGNTPTQAQANKLDAAGNQISQAKQDIEAGNNFKGAFNAARGVNQALDAGGATLGDKASLAWTGAKAVGSAALAKLTGQNPQAAAADSVAKSIVGPLSGVDTKQAAATAQQYRGPNAKDITKDPQFAKLPLAKQQQVTQAQQQIRDMGDDDFANVQNFNAKQTTANLAAAMKEEQGNDFNTYTTNAQGQRLQQSPNLMGVQQTKNLDTGDTTTDYNQGPMSASQTKNAAGATTAKAQSVDLGVAKFGTKQQQPNYAAGQLASPTVAKVSVPAGNATVTQKSYAGPMLGGASGPGVGNNVITKAARVVPNANPAKSAVDPAAAADATATANQLSQAAAPALNKQPGLQERSHPVETFEMADGSCLECYGDDEQGYELRRQGNSLPSRFKTRKHAKMAVDLFRARRKQNQDLSQDYIQEK
jgi:hypothetical protein